MSDLASRVAAVLQQLVPGNPAVLDELRALYDDSLHFRDPIQEVNGLDEFLAMNQRLLRKMKTIDWRIHSTFGDEATALIEWTMYCKPKHGPQLAVDGVTRVQARNGRVIDHRDYWDLSELVASAAPFGERVRHFLMKPLA